MVKGAEMEIVSVREKPELVEEFIKYFQEDSIMKKLLSVILVGIMVLSLAACGGPKGEKLSMTTEKKGSQTGEMYSADVYYEPAEAITVTSDYDNKQEIKNSGASHGEGLPPRNLPRKQNRRQIIPPTRRERRSSVTSRVAKVTAKGAKKAILQLLPSSQRFLWNSQ